MKTVFGIAGIGLALYILHRLALWAESHGYIYYLKTQPSRNALGNALLETQSLLEPDKSALVQVIREERSELAESGEPPNPDNASYGDIERPTP